MATSHDNHHPEKAFAVARTWAEAHSNSHVALLRRSMDNRVFDSEDPIGYLDGFEVSELGIDLEALTVVNAEPADLTMGQMGRALSWVQTLTPLP